MNKKTRHKWTIENNNFFATCKICRINKHIKIEKILQPNGNSKIFHHVIYKDTTGKEIKNSGCIKQSQLNFNF
jgi:hypothetical protein